MYINVKYFNLIFTYIGCATLGCPGTLVMHIMCNSSTTMLELIIILLHVDGLAGVAVEGQHTQEGN